ncbi:MAG: hypothetical protein IKE46_07965 [Selenomonadaceae bacterium]|nr:hypothetical protein [Selenomonadaceae bacterium]MBR4384181.1 hypothetical protein [Selenomonadaceae bacterium]
MISTCKLCSCRFETYKSKEACPVCRDKRRREQTYAQKKVDESIGKPTKTLDDWCREAAECNLDYGTYRTLVEIQGKTFDKLKAQSPFRHTSAHAHGHHTRSIRDD